MPVEIYLRLLPVSASDKLVEQYLCDSESGPRHTRILDYAKSFESREAALAYVRAHRLDPKTLELVTLTAEALDAA